jgi:hypothetical protein
LADFPDGVWRISFAYVSRKDPAMTVKIRQFRTGGFEVDIRFTCPDGSTFRRRLKAPVEGKTAAKRWARAPSRAGMRSR